MTKSAPITAQHSSGSVWRRWDPHLHTPGTVLNDQFGQAEPWGDYLDRIERATPQVEALGITDYWSLDRYDEVQRFKAEGRLPGVGLIFANVEIRLGIGTQRGGPVNAHLLISPETDDHVEQGRRLLAQLTFRAHHENFRCNRDDLIRLGQQHDAALQDESGQLAAGTNQFKVTLDELRRAFDESAWARKNVLVAVAASSGGGSSGLVGDASLTTLRKEIERFADVIFSGNTGDREFWHGEGTLSEEQLTDEYDGTKPCLHGSDAHELDRVCVPDLERYTWIKGDASFESLRQACIEPGERAFVGPQPPDGALPYEVVRSIEVRGADWCVPSVIELNSGLVGIIGARGSGKTALADLIALAAGSPDVIDNSRSFVSRAGEHLSGVQVRITWRDGHDEEVDLDRGASTSDVSPGVQYLSQQFVERLCSSEGGVTDELLSEIERVIYGEHSADDRAGTTSFTELRDLRAGASRSAQARSRQVLDGAVEQISDERRKSASLKHLHAEESVTKTAVDMDRKARRSLLGTGNATERAERLGDVQTAIEQRQAKLDDLARRQRALETLRDTVADVRNRIAAQEIADFKRAHADSGLTDAEWKQFRRDFSGDVDAVVAQRLEEVTTTRDAAMGPGLAEEVQAGEGSYVAEDADLSKTPLAALTREAERLRHLIGIDARKVRQLKQLDTKIERAERELRQLRARVVDAQGAPARIEELKQTRKHVYAQVFDALIEEESQLTALYAPLAQTLKTAEGALRNLSFTVRRRVDIERWSRAGEDLLDLRTAGPFKGHGALLKAAREELLPALESGTGTEVSAAMASFRERHDHALLEHSPVSPTDRSDYWAWAARVAKWLDSTDHIAIGYGVEYDGVDIEQLSPGTRGIVLLLLYLSIDRSDTRPLIIDQPEENLDPKSVFDELVTRFRAARRRRQVIVVTHNANLVVNTDADQVIVASAGSHRPGQLPTIQYESGGLENVHIRRAVCEILEGGEQAFKERARRLRVQLAR